MNGYITGSSLYPSDSNPLSKTSLQLYGAASRENFQEQYTEREHVTLNGEMVRPQVFWVDIPGCSFHVGLNVSLVGFCWTCPCEPKVRHLGSKVIC